MNITPTPHELAEAELQVLHLTAAGAMLDLLRGFGPLIDKLSADRINASIASRAGVELRLTVSATSRSVCEISISNPIGRRIVLRRVVAGQPGQKA